jgi:hypothetical protein
MSVKIDASLFAGCINSYLLPSFQLNVLFSAFSLWFFMHSLYSFGLEHTSGKTGCSLICTLNVCSLSYVS